MHLSQAYLIYYIFPSLTFLLLIFLYLYINERRRRKEGEKEKEILRRQVEDIRKVLNYTKNRMEEKERILIMLPEFVSKIITTRSEEKVRQALERAVSSIMEIENFEIIWEDGLDRLSKKNREFIDYVMKGGVPLSFEEYTAMSPGREKRESKYALCIPLKAFDRTYGVLCIDKIKEREEKRRYLTLLSQIAASAVDNLYLFKRIEEIATMDSLTGLKNRRYFFHECEKLLEKAKRKIKPLSICIFDIDHFKKFNDTYGHPAGDEILKDFAWEIKMTFPDEALKARYGGEEFVVALPDVDKKHAMEMAEKLRRKIEKKGKTTVSGGIASYPEDAKEMEGIIKKADDALYKAKENGRNRIILWE